MESKEFKMFRSRLERTQKEMAQLLGISIKAVHSYEQGWRKIPGHVERQIYFLLSRTLRGTGEKKKVLGYFAMPGRADEPVPGL